MKSKTKILFGGILGALFAVWILLLKTVDVAPAGDSRTEVGFSGLNQAFFDAFHGHTTLYSLTEVLGIAAILVAGVFALLGLWQTIRRHNPLKADREILALGGLYIVFGVLYVLFEIFVVNCRPVIMPDAAEAEASFPSTHTVLICVIMGSAIMVLPKYIKNAFLCRVLQVLCGIAIAVTVLGRLFSGVHWLTDIIGGVLLSGALLFVFSGVLGLLNEKPES